MPAAFRYWAYTLQSFDIKWTDRHNITSHSPFSHYSHTDLLELPNILHYWVNLTTFHLSTHFSHLAFALLHYRNLTCLL